MKTKIDAGDASYALYENSIIQAYTRAAYWVSGGEATPGTSSTEMTVQVATGEARINDSAVTWADEEVILADAGVGPNGQDQNEPRVDVIYVTQSGALDSTTGDPSAYAPDTDASGAPLTPSPFEHWEPSPDSGSGVGGVALALVLVKPDWASAQDMSAGEIKNWKLSASSDEVFVKGDGTDNGKLTIESSGDDVSFIDSTLDFGSWLHYEPSNKNLNIGSVDIVPWLQNNLNMNSHSIVSLADPTGEAQAANKRYVDNALDAATNGLLPLDGSRVMQGDLNMGSNQVLGVQRVGFLGTAGGSNPPRIYYGQENNMVFQAPDGATYPFAGPTA